MAQPLRGVTCFVSVGGSAGDASGAVAARARALGAATTQRLTSSCSHVILGGADAGRAARVLRQLSTLPTGVAVVDARWGMYTQPRCGGGVSQAHNHFRLAFYMHHCAVAQRSGTLKPCFESWGGSKIMNFINF